MPLMPQLVSLVPSVGTTAATVVVAVVTILSYYSIKFRHWSSRQIRGPKPMPVLGTLIRRQELGWHDNDMADVKAYGKIHGAYQGTTPVLVVADADMLKEILVSDFSSFANHRPSYHTIQKQDMIHSNGKRWKEQRNIISPAFTSGKLRAMHHLIREKVDQMIAFIDNSVKSGNSELDSSEVFGNLSLGVIARCGFGTETNPYCKQTENIMLDKFRQFFHFSFLRMALVILLPEWLLRFLEMNAAPRDSFDYIIPACRQILRQRLEQQQQQQQVSGSVVSNGSSSTSAAGKKHVDLLQSLMEGQVSRSDGTVDKLTEEEIVANSLLILLAGYHTTSAFLTFFSYVLAMYPEIQQRLVEEIREATGREEGSVMQAETIMSLKYLDAVVNETLRRYPPVVFFERQATEDHTFVKQGISVRKGDWISVPVYTIHHLEEHFPDPFTFDPQRFMPENKDQLVPYTFLPFVAGPRNCIGARFALLEAKTAIVSLLQRYEVRRCDRTTEKLDLSGTLVLLTSNPVILEYVPRTL